MVFIESYKKYKDMRKWELIEELLYYRRQHGYLKEEKQWKKITRRNKQQ